jgi:hypothetical protein
MEKQKNIWIENFMETEDRQRLADAEKSVNAIRKQYPMATQAQLLPFVKAFVPSMSDGDIRATLEGIFAKEVKKSKRKKL